MEPCDSPGVRCLAVVRRVVVAEQWLLTEAEQLALAQRVAICVSPDCSDEDVRSVAWNVYCDAPLVDALRSRDATDHEAEWLAWFGQARAILHHTGLDWVSDDAVDLDDLAQVALVELLRSLPSFRFASRFSTWAYQVISNAVNRHLRDLHARKRSGTFDRTVDWMTLPVEDPDPDTPEKMALGRMLDRLVETELIRTMGERNARIFHLWACDDLSAEMIGHRVHLSTARIHAIIAEARAYLRARPDLRHWHDGGIY
ncbi:sigma-70 family RNA polymerase sigma factor [Candidatus Chloroploca asiatica]|uniref:sigma-70 family RNA polymerase sigma factor n=1 Tax=Candidatus Chloroploca asiatica TaxID=1506545 RepID=UPI000BE861A0|nr:sigma-70 family RNA polymerase sigma factor [Candidatus Chloroploca asiatica]